MKDMKDTALDIGFSDAVVVKTEDIPFEPGFRVCCEDNACGKYGVNYSCPPICGSCEEMRLKVQALPHALVMQSMWDIDYDDGAAIKRCKGTHNQWTRQLIGAFRDRTRGFMIGASGCSLCDPCAFVTGQPCRFPEQMASCTSAYCIYVQKLTEGNGMEYDSGPGLVNFFSLYVFEEL